MKSIPANTRWAMLAAGALTISLALAACGSSSSSSASNTTATSATSSAAARRGSFFACLRSHGVTLPNRPAGAPPPGAGGGFFGGGFRGGALRNNPKFRAAFQACGGTIRFRGRPGGFRISHTAIDSFVSCVRKHGYPEMPSPNFSGKGPIFPASIRTNSKFQAASRTCLGTLRPGAAGGTSSSSSGE